MIKGILSISRLKKKIFTIFFDTVSIFLILFISFFIRFDHFLWISPEILWLIFLAPPIAIPVFTFFGLYKNLVRFISFKALWEAFQAVSVYALLWGMLVYMTSVEGIPRSIVLINWLLALIIISGSRMAVRWIIVEYINSSNKFENVIIYGAGKAGRQLSKALSHSDEYKPVVFIDDSPEIVGQTINGLKVFKSDSLGELIDKLKIKGVVLALPSINRVRKKEIIKDLNAFPVFVRSLPSLSKLAQGKIKIEDLMDIDVADLLGRDAVDANNDLLEINIKNKSVLVTGAGGSIGSELCRQILLLKPKNLILFDISESALYQIDQELLNLNNDEIKIFPFLGSVRDSKRLESIFNLFKIHTIYHAAAYKHVPLVEFNQSQGVLNNAIGTYHLVRQAIFFKVDTFVLISTDKAVRPSSTMGATKRVAELVLQAYAKTASNTCLTMVRFGNVLGSSGSVIPLFRKQIKEGGPVTVTDANMVRYFMTIPEAVELVIQAGAMGTGGDVFVLDMGKPVKIYDLAVKMIKLSGLTLISKENPNGDIEIKYTGVRPGEKLYEELLVGNNVTQTENKLIMRAEESMIDLEELEPIIEELEYVSINFENEKIRELLFKIVPEFESQSKK